MDITSEIKDTFGLDAAKDTFGLEAARETGGYQWQKDAERGARLQSEAYLLDEQQKLIGSAKNIQQNAQQAAITSELGKYTMQQTNEKRGWTGGGSALDMEQQLNYLKSSIQADLYTQAEMQKFGYQNILDKARMEYELGKHNLALEYYKTALEYSVALASATDRWFSPEMIDQLNQGRAAQDILDDETASEEDKERAQKIVNAVDKWFADNGLSKTGWLTAAGELKLAQAYHARMEALAAEAEFNEAVQRAYKAIKEEGRIAIPKYNDDGTIIGYMDLITATPDQQRDYFYENGKFNQSKLIDALEDAYYDISEVKNLLENVAPDGTYEIDGFTITKRTNADGGTEFDIVHNNPQAFLDKEKNNDGSYSVTISEVETWMKSYAPDGSEVSYIIAERDANGKVTAYYAVKTAIKDGEVTTYKGSSAPTVEAAQKALKEIGDLTPKEMLEYQELKEKYEITEDSKGLDPYTAKPKDFGSFWDIDKKGSKQYEYVQKILKGAREGKIPDGTLIAFNYGLMWNDSGIYVYIKGKFYKVKEEHSDSTPAVKAAEEKYNTTVYTNYSIDELLE